MSARTWRPDGPGSFLAPPGVHAVHDRTGRLWTRDTTRWTSDGSSWIRWRVLVAEHGPVTEATGHPAQRRAAASSTRGGRTS
ncbi:hypothetical protein [Streptomyces sp. MNU103]|uniref:hypothetical protein n=1 Tax=Streptomyces sp. MNU103 TaxID=2560024 RepID=UPI001E543A51|nr:hypothetical protein [Streptomyces sp. MNU103]